MTRFLLHGKDKNLEINLTPTALDSFVKVNGMSLPCREITLRAVAGQGTYVTLGLFPSGLELMAQAHEIEKKSAVEDERLKGWDASINEARSLANKRNNGRLRGKEFAQVAAPMLETLTSIQAETEDSTDEEVHGVYFQATVLYWRLHDQLSVEMAR